MTFDQAIQVTKQAMRAGIPVAVKWDDETEAFYVEVCTRGKIVGSWEFHTALELIPLRPMVRG